MSDEREQPRAGGSWRTIRQEVAPRAMSRRGRRRQLFGMARAVALVVLVGLSSWGLYAVVRAWETDRAALASAVHSRPVRDVVVLTNGVLTRAWAEKAMALPRGTTLMALDLGVLRDRLMASGQVSVAVLTRNFPDTLVVNLQERTPVARLQVDAGDGAARALLVARDGVVYDGAHYEPALLGSLPWLAGLSLRRSATGGFEPVAGIDVVSDLLSTAQLQAPHLYRGWLIVSLERLREHGELVVRAQDVPEIVFSARNDFLRQVAQLDYILDQAAQAAGAPALQSVNLALGSQVPVTFAPAAATGAAQPARPPRPAPVFSLQPPSRNPKRDL